MHKRNSDDLRRSRLSGWQRVFAGVRNLPARLLYALLGLLGVLMWLLVHLPIGERARSSTLVAMAGCIGLCTMGWRMIGAQTAGQRRR